MENKDNEDHTSVKPTSDSTHTPENDASETVEEPKPLTEFTCFKRLPIEIRLMIWEIATDSEDGRVIEIKLTSVNNFDRFYTPNVVPGILQASRESRQCGLKKYERLDVFSSKTGWNDIDIPRFVTCLDYNRDMVYVCNTTFHETGAGPALMEDFLSIFIPPSQRKCGLSYSYGSSYSCEIRGTGTLKLQHLAMDFMDLRGFEQNWGMLRTISQLDSLRSISMVYSDLCMHNPDTIMSMVPENVLPYAKITGWIEKLYARDHLALNRYQALWSVMDEFSMCKLMSLLKKKLKGMGMCENVRASLEVVLIDIERGEIDEEIFDDSPKVVMY